jgi:hypothetical protein
MSQRSSEVKARLGFLQVVEIAAAGHVGGLLVSNHLGRPLEFQCTTPVRPNRTQEILYGPTLKAVVLSELIGKTLADRVQVKPDLIVVDQPELLDLRRLIEVPVLLLERREGEDDSNGICFPGWNGLVHADFAEDVARAAELTRFIPDSADIHEPLERVAEALFETLRGGAAA